MNILGIDSSGLVASVAVLKDETLVAEFTINNKQTHSQTLLPMLDQTLRMAGVSLKEMDAIAISAGPGSFTGLRIGSATAKGLALAQNKPIVSVPTLEGLAYRMAMTEGVICPLMDARRNQVYTGIYKMQEEQLKVLSEQEATDIVKVIEKINEFGEKAVFLGDGVPVHKEILKNTLKVPYVFAPSYMNRQSAATIAALGKQYFEAGKSEGADAHRPVYLRQSQAERERAKKLQTQNAEG